MFRPSDARLWLIVGLLFGASHWPNLVCAQEEVQDEYVEPRRPRSLSQRLEQFRKDLVGDREAEEEGVQPRQTGMQQNAPANRTNTNVKGYPAAARTATRPTVPASRVIARDRQPQAQPRESVRVAAKPTREDADFVEPAQRRAASTESNGELKPANDETRPGKLSASSARPARRGGAFELPTPRVARSVQAEETAEEVQEEPERVVESAEPTSRGSSNALFTAKSPMLSVEATGPRKVLVGREVDFNIVLRNVGEVVASGVVVKINIPAFAEVIGTEPSSGSAPVPTVSKQASVLEWKVDRVDIHGNESLRLKLIPRKSVPLDLAMQWTCTPESSQAVVEVQEPKLNLGLSGPREVFYGQSKIYKLTISNPGNGDAENVSVSLLPIGRSGDAPANYRLGILRAGDSKTIDIELTARQAGTLAIKAQAFGDGGLRADVSEPVVVRRAQLKVAIGGSKVKYAGTPSLYRVRIANAGDAAADRVELSAILPPGAKFLKASNNGKYVDNNAKVVWQIGTMQPGDDRTFDVYCTLNSPGDNSVQAVADAGDDLSATASTATTVEALADLKMEVRDPQGPVAVGDEVEYEIVVRNRGTKAAEGIDIIAFFSEGLEASTVTGADHQIAPGQVTIKTIPTVEPGSEMSVRMRCKSDRGGNLVFRAEMTCRNPGTKLAAEETTHFYGDETSAPPIEEASAPTQKQADAAPIEDEPAAAVEEEASATGSRSWGSYPKR